jgi:uncharacterized protein
MQVAFPYHLDGRQRTAEASEDEHVRQLVEAVLFTAPGERLYRPDFGSGVQQLLFGPASPDLAATVQALIQGALQQWLGDRLKVEAVEVRSADSTLRIGVQYTRLRTHERRVLVIEREIPA